MSLISENERLKITKMITGNNILILLLLIISTCRGTHAVGFDSASSCSPNNKQSRRGRAQILATIPCDLTREAYCNVAGPSYPWRKVRQFVHDNQGLMKRMYGDMHQISVLRDEIRNNEIDGDDIEIAAERYSRRGPRRSSKFFNERARERLAAESDSPKIDIVTEIPMTTEKSPSTTSTTTTLESEADSTERPPIKKPEIVVEEPAVKSFKEDELERKIEPTRNLSTNDNKNIYIIDDGNLATNSILELPTLIANDIIALSTSGDNIEIIASPKLNTTPSTPTSSTTTQTTTTTEAVSPTTPQTTTTATTTRSTTKRASIYHYNDSYRRRPQYTNRYRPIHYQQKPHQQIHRINTTKLTLKEGPSENILKLKPNETEQISNTSTTQVNATAPTMMQMPQRPSIAAPTANAESSPIISVKLKINGTNQTIENNSPTQKKPWAFNNQFATTPLSSSPSSAGSLASTLSMIQQKVELFSAKKFYKHQPKPPTSTPTPKPSGQLYQDTVKQDNAPVANAKGINACPVKEEVVAPFWANNTRGEILALLNVYPFEQYVHWEKCTQENKQMYCRDGCRCEQQYSLHRLLAYDPYNECRGIFSDWFRFPSSCVCRCYNIPAEFRATSRSPRMQSYDDEEAVLAEDEEPRDPLEIAEEQVRRAIYEHATEDWYHPNDDDGDGDGDGDDYNYFEDY